MDRKRFAVIKYDHGERVGLSDTRKLWLVIFILLALGLVFIFFPLSLILGLAAAVVAHQPKQLCVGPRYVICGNKILYYANIEKVTLERGEGRLTLLSSTGQVLELEQDRFQTNARKPDKIAAHKAARFNKVALKIVDRVRSAAPHAQLTGTRGLRATGT
jgi:hypothetical protein